MALKKQCQRPTRGADIDRLPKTIQDQHMLVEYRTHFCSNWRKNYTKAYRLSTQVRKRRKKPDAINPGRLFRNLGMITKIRGFQRTGPGCPSNLGTIHVPGASHLGNARSGFA